MSLFLAWVVFPLVLVAVGAGWGVLVEKAVGREVQGALVLPIGLAAALVAAGNITAFKVTAPAAVWVVGLVGLGGLVAAWPGRRVSWWPVLAGAAILFVYGAPVLFSGQATLAGYIRLDDTSTWLGITDQLFAHGRSLALPATNTFTYNLNAYLGLTGYPVGAFMLLGVGRGLTGIDAAWVLQPDLALCGVLVGLAVYAMFERLVASRPLRAGLAFVAAQPALLYGYGMWGGIKELTAAWVVIAGIALAAPYIGRRAPKPREALPLAIAAAALFITLGPGALVWIGPALLGLAASWAWALRRGSRPREMIAASATLVGATALLALPMWLVISTFLSTDSGLFAAPGGPAGREASLGNLAHALSAFQLAGIWPVGDFRFTPRTGPTAILIGLVLVCAIGAIVVSVRRHDPAILLYVLIALVGSAAIKLTGGSPWVVAKSLAIASPALLAGGLLGAALLLERARVAGIVTCALLICGVLWSNVLAYHDVTLAPRARLAELQQIGKMIAGDGPTLLNEYEVYGDRHFLRAGQPTGPAEYRPALLNLRDGRTLTKSAYADLDSFPLATLLTFRTIVTRTSPTQSRPPSVYRLVWQGHWYQLWQRAARPSATIVEHIPLGDSNQLPYCGTANQGSLGLCSIAPVDTPACTTVTAAGQLALKVHGELVAYQQPEPIVARATQALGPPNWTVNPQTGTVTPTTPGTMFVRFRVTVAQHYALWLGGSFARGFKVSIDGHPLGQIKDQLQNIGTYEHVSTVKLSKGSHTVELVYPHPDLTPGSGEQNATTLSTVALDALDTPRAQMLTVAPGNARTLCGRLLDWIEVVKPSDEQ